MSRSSRPAFDFPVPAAVFALTLLLNLSVRSYFFNFDGVACAVAVELSDFKHLVHGNHLAYGVLAWVFDQSWRLLGYGGRALYPLQALSGLLGAAAAAVFSSLLLRAGRSTREALLGGVALALSHAWWYWSLEAQVYMLGALFIALAAREVLGEKPRPWLVGAWHAAAILGHVGHVMAAPALTWALPRRRRDVLEYGISAALVTAIAYLAAAAFAVRPATFEEWRVWLLGSAALTADRHFAWHNAPLASSAADWLKMSLTIFLAEGPARPLVLFALIAAAWGLRRGGRTAHFWGLWLLGYAALYLTWEPNTIVYRITDLLALYALAFEGLKQWPARRRALALAAWCGVAGLHNWSQAVLPASRPDANIDLNEALWSGRSTPENAWVLAAGRGRIYLPYFAGRKPLDPRYWRDETYLFARLDALAKEGEPVYAADRSLALSQWTDSFARYGLADAGRGGGFQLYRVLRTKPR